MKKTSDKFWLLIPTALFPYVIIGIIAAFFISNWNPGKLSNIILENLNVLGIAAAGWFVLSFIFNILYIALPKTTDARKILRAALIIKCIHIPTYIVIFIFGLMLGIMFFMTFPLIVILFIIDLLTLFLSNFISIYALAQSIKQKSFGNNAAPITAIVCQFFFCADLISMIVAFCLCKKKV